MTTLHRTRVAWTGWVGGPGVSTYFFTGNQDVNLGKLRTMLDAMKGNIPAIVTLTIEGTGQDIDTVTGKAVDSWTAAQPAAVQGTGAAGYPAPSGYQITWKTGTYVNGRELRGRTFMVPASGQIWDPDGSMGNPTRTGLQTQATSFVTSMAGDQVVYHRATGAIGQVNQAVVGDKAVVLTSRRD